MIDFHRTKQLMLTATIIAGLVFVLSSGSMAQEGLQRYSEELAAITSQVTPAVVSIYGERSSAKPEQGNERNAPFEEEFFNRYFREPEGLRSLPSLPGRVIRRVIRDEGNGTGIIMDGDGHIVTSSHVVGDRHRGISVRLADGRKLKANLMGTDPESGVAVIKVDSENLTPAKTGDSDRVRAGEVVLAFGDHRGMGVTVSLGIVGATGRSGLDIAAYEDLIQTDAGIGPGSSGGALVNARGEVIGMLIAYQSDAAAAFAVPVNTVREIMKDLMDDGEVTRGWLGIQIQEVSAELAEKMEMEEPAGALVVDVGKDSPAEKGGMESGDVIVRFDDKPVKNLANLRSVVERTAPGREVTVAVVRKGEKKELRVTIGERMEKSITALDKKAVRSEKAGWMGITVQELTPELAEKLGYAGEEGVLISEVMKGSSADEKGLQSGDLIQEIEHHPIKSLKDYEEAIKETADLVLVRIKRDEKVWYDVLDAGDK